VVWVDDVTGAPLVAEELAARGGPLRLRVPAFVRHVAAVLERGE
jgi:hypothetical protein